jgi:hypothetical protein
MYLSCFLHFLVAALTFASPTSYPTNSWCSPTASCHGCTTAQCQWCSYGNNDDNYGYCQQIGRYCSYTEYLTPCPNSYSNDDITDDGINNTGVLFCVIFFPICIFCIIVLTSPLWLPILGFAACWSYSRRTNKDGN